MKDSAVVSTVSTVKMGVHIGNALRYVTDNYPTITKVVLELIQNSLDSESSEITVIIDYKTKVLVVRDNGCGISPEKFEQAVSSVCSSIKTKDKLGQFGIGLLSPLGKCKGFVITSAAKASKHEYNRWVFNSDQILKSATLPDIPVVPMPNVFYATSMAKSSKERIPVDWRTEVCLDHFSNDKSINSVSLVELKSLILGQFSEAMRKLNASVNVTIKRADSAKKEYDSFKAANFNGERLGEVVYGDKKSERTSFDIYLAPKTKLGRKGQIIVGIEGNDFRIPMPLFLRSVPELDSDVVGFLTSGTFEGSIISSSCELHTNRKEFCDNEARLSFLINLESWVRHHGQKHVVSIKDGERDTWLQAVGSLAINQLEARLKNQFPHLLDVVKTFRVGTIGPGHQGFAEAKQQQSFNSANKFGRKNGHGADAEGQGIQKNPNADREPTLHPGHTPFTVAGEGNKRRKVKGHSTGMQFVYEELPGNDHHWEFDAETGILTFNMRSDIWEKMERSERKEVVERNLILYQQYIAIKALELQLQPPSFRPQIFEFLQQELRSSSIFITTQSSFLQPRKPKSEVGKKV